MRRVFAILDVDEEKLIRYPSDSIGDRLEQELNHNSKNGIAIESWTIMDNDDEDPYARYLNYLVDWVDAQAAGYDESGKSPLPYEKWYSRPVMLVNANICISMIEDLGNGEPTEHGERTSKYFHFARSADTDPMKFCSAALIERTVLEPGHEQEYYELHVINDIDMTSCRTYTTTYKSRSELAELIHNILKKIKEMRY